MHKQWMNFWIAQQNTKDAVEPPLLRSPMAVLPGKGQNTWPEGRNDKYTTH